MRFNLALDGNLISVVSLIKINSKLRNFLLVTVGSFLLMGASKLSIPLSPVPITLQTLAIFFIGMIYGWRLGTAAILFYLLEGLVGIPVFAGPEVGLSVFLGPTGGYLIGFVPAVFISGYLVEHGFGRNFITVGLAAIIGSIPLYICGLMVLANFVGIHASITLGLIPFLLSDLLKIIFLACVVPVFWKQKNN